MAKFGGGVFERYELNDEGMIVDKISCEIYADMESLLELINILNYERRNAQNKVTFVEEKLDNMYDDIISARRKLYE